MFIDFMFFHLLCAGMPIFKWVILAFSNLILEHSQVNSQPAPKFACSNPPPYML